MKTNIFLVFCVLAVLSTSCGNATIISPQKGDLKNSPLDIIVEHSGCGYLQVFLDYNTPQVKDITGLLKDRNGQYVAEKVEIPTGIHEISAQLKREGSGACYFTSGQSWKFEVVEAKTCISGIITYEGCTPFTFFDINIYDGKNPIASGMADENGRFCLEFVPTSKKVNIGIAGGIDPCICSADILNFELSSDIDLSCPGNNCIDLGEIKTTCGPG